MFWWPVESDRSISSLPPEWYLAHQKWCIVRCAFHDRQPHLETMLFLSMPLRNGFQSNEETVNRESPFPEFYLHMPNFQKLSRYLFVMIFSYETKSPNSATFLNISLTFSSPHRAIVSVSSSGSLSEQRQWANIWPTDYMGWAFSGISDQIFVRDWAQSSCQMILRLALALRAGFDFPNATVIPSNSEDTVRAVSMEFTKVQNWFCIQRAPGLFLWSLEV